MMLQGIQSNSEPATGPELDGFSANVVRAIQKGCAAFSPIGSSAKIARVESLIAARAWTEAALALVAIEVPEWGLRRIEIDDGEWFCSLQRHPAVPLDFDDHVEGRHRLLALAILAALAEAQGQPPPDRRRPPDRSATNADSTTVWCDNCR